MRINDDVLKIISTPKVRRKLAVALDMTEQTIISYLKKNSDDLTKAAALKVIREATGKTDEEILVESESVV